MDYTKWSSKEPDKNVSGKVGEVGYYVPLTTYKVVIEKQDAEGDQTVKSYYPIENRFVIANMGNVKISDAEAVETLLNRTIEEFKIKFKEFKEK